METLDEKNEGGMSQRAFHEMTGTSQWLKIAGIVYMALGGISILFLLYAMTKGATNVVFLIALLIYALMVFLGLLSFKQGNALSAFGMSKGSSDLEEFSKNFKTFWTITGVLSILFALIWLILILVGVSGGGGRMF